MTDTKHTKRRKKRADMQIGTELHSEIRSVLPHGTMSSRIRVLLAGWKLLTVEQQHAAFTAKSAPTDPTT